MNFVALRGILFCLSVVSFVLTLHVCLLLPTYFSGLWFSARFHYLDEAQHPSWVSHESVATVLRMFQRRAEVDSFLLFRSSLRFLYAYFHWCCTIKLVLLCLVSRGMLKKGHVHGRNSMSCCCEQYKYRV